MKKILLLVVSLMILCFSSVAMAASNGQLLTKEEAAANQIISAFTGKTSYSAVSGNFAPELIAKFDEAALKNVKKDVAEKFGKIGEKKLLVLQKFDQADKLAYIASFTKQERVAIELLFKVENDDVKLLGFTMTPIEIQQQQEQQQNAQTEQK